MLNGGWKEMDVVRCWLRGKPLFRSVCFMDISSLLTKMEVFTLLFYLSNSWLSKTNRFFNTLMAYNSFVYFSSASKTYLKIHHRKKKLDVNHNVLEQQVPSIVFTFPKFPLPNTAKRLKSSRPTFPFICTGVV
jgi:hypothetical protein